MAASDKNILISPQRGSTTQVPSIVFTGDGNDPITLRVLDGVPGSLSFEGGAGQLFSITDNLTSGSIFSVNDVSGLPSLDVNASGAVQIAPFGGTVAIGQSTVASGQTVDIKGNVRIDGTLTGTDVRAPIFYDSDNTAFYVNPNATSRLSDLHTTSATFGSRANSSIFGGNTTGLSGASQVLEVRASGSIPLMTWHYENIATRHIGLDSSGFLQVYNPGEGGGSVLQANTSLRAPIFIDSNDTGYYVDPAATSVVNGIVSSDYIRIRGNKGIMGDYDTDGTASKVIWTIGASWPLGNMYGLGYEYGFVFDHHLALKNNGITYSRFGFAGGMYLTGTGTASSSWRAPIFYDSDNTDYYIDPASQTNLNYLRLANNNAIYFSSTLTAEFNHDSNSTPVAFHMIKSGSSFTDGSNYGVLSLVRRNHNNSATSAGAGLYFVLKDDGGTDREYAGIYGRKTIAGAAGGELVFMNYGRNEIAYCNEDYFSHVSDIRAPIFYDSNNTTYYFDGNGTSRFGTVRIFSNAGADWDAIEISTTGVSGIIQGLGDENGLRIRSEGGDIYLADNRGAVQAPIVYDVSNTAYYLDAASSTTSLSIAGAIEQGSDFAHPNIEWSASGGSTGMVIFRLPGGTGNYGMVHMVFDYYEYNSPRVATIIVGGHNWNGAWYNIACNVVGFIDKSVRVGVKDGQYCVVFGEAGSSWNYGTVRLRKIHNGSFYSNVMDLGGAYSVAQTTTESFSHISGDLRQLRTSNAFIASGSITAPVYYDLDNTGYYADLSSTGNSLNIAGSLRASTYNKPGILTVASGSSSSGGSIAIQQETAEGWTGIFCDFEPYTGWGLWHDNPNNYFSFTSESPTGGLRSFTVPSRVSGDRTAYEKFRVDQNNGDIVVGGNGHAIGSLRAPIFYDYNDTAYWVDPANSGFNLRGGAGNRVTYSTTDSGIYVTNAEGSGTTVRLGAAWGRPGVYNNTYLSLGAESYLEFVIQNGQKAYIDGNSDLYVFGSTRSPIFYDQNDTAYYTDPNGYSRLNRLVVNQARVNSSRYPLGHYASGDTVFEIDPTWTDDQLQAYFNNGGFSWVDDSTAPGGYAISVAGARYVGGDYGAGFPFIPVDQDDIFYMEVWIKDVSGTNGHYMGSVDYSSSFGNLGGNPGSFGYWVMQNTYPGTSWTKYSGYITGFGSSTGQFKSGTKYFTPLALFNYSGGGTSYISGWKCVRVTHQGNRTIVGRSGSITDNSTYALDVFHPSSYRQLRIRSSNDPLIKFSGSYNGGNGAEIWQNGTGALLFNSNSSTTAFVSYPDPYTVFNGSARTPVFYDSDNTGYYADLAGATNLNEITVNGSAQFYNWVRTHGEEGLYSQSYGQHFYPDSGGHLWESDGPIRIRDGYEGTIRGTLGYHDGNGFGMLSYNGNWWLNTPADQSMLIIGGSDAWNAYDSVTGRRLMFGGGNADAQSNYYIGTNLDNYGGNYNKLDLRWHTGIRMGAQPNYGGIRFYDSEDLGTQVFAINKDGAYAQANQSMRAPIFYDLDNTGYYVDPTSTTNLSLTQTHDLRALGQVRATGWYNQNSGSHTGPAIEIGVSSPGSSNGYILAYNRDNSSYLNMNFAATSFSFNGQSGGFLTCDTSIRSPIFYDSYDTAYYSDPNSNSNLINVQAQKYFVSGGFSDTTNNSPWYGLGLSNVGGPAGGNVVQLGGYWGIRLQTGWGRWEIEAPSYGGSGWTYGTYAVAISNETRSTIHYDYNNTAYYSDPNSTSSLWGLAIRGDFGSTNTDNQIFFWGAGNTTTSAIGFKANGGYFANPTGSGDGYNTYFTMDTDGRGWVFRRGVGGGDFGAAYTSGWILNNGIWQANSSMRAPLFYDSNDTGYYVDPASTTQLNAARFASGGYTRTYSFTPAGTKGSGYVWVRASMGGFNGGGDTVRFTVTRSIGDNGNDPYGGCTADFTAHSREWHSGQETCTVFYTQHGGAPYGQYITNAGPRDLAGGGYWFYMRVLQGVTYRVYVHAESGAMGDFDPASQSDPGSVPAVYTGFNILGSGGNSADFVAQNISYGLSSVRAPIFYDNDNTGYYLDPASTSYVQALQTNGNLTVGNSTSSNIYMTDTDETTRIIHCNTNRIGFLNSGGAWSSYSDNTGNWITDYIGYAGQSFRAPIFYDSNDTGYYTDPNDRSLTNEMCANKMRADTNRNYADNQGWWAHDPYGYGWGKPHGSFRTLEVSSSGDFSNEPAMFRIHQWGSGSAEFWKPKGTIMYLRETPGGSSTWFTNFQVTVRTDVPILYDYDNTAFYSDPNGVSRLVAIDTVGGTYNTFRTWTDLPGYHGFYSSVHNSAHFYPNNGSYGSWRIDGSRDGWRGLNFDNAVVLMMNDNETGHHRNGYGWQWRWYNGTMYVYKNAQGGGTGATVWDSSNAPRASNSNLMYYQGFTLDANTMDTNATGFTYSVNAPYTGPIVRFSTGSGAGYDLWLNAPYSGGGNALAFRTRNGDTGSLNSWYYLAAYNSGALNAVAFYDQDDTGYYCDPNATSILNNLTVNGTLNAYSNAIVVNRINFRDTSGSADSDPYCLRWMDESANGGLSWLELQMNDDYNEEFRIYGNSCAGYGCGQISGNLYHRFRADGWAWHSDYVEGGSSVRGPIFYDSNDTGYYLDPNSTGLSQKIAGNFECYARSAAWAEGIRVRVPSRSTWGGIRFTRDEGNYNGNWAIGYTGIDASDDLTFWGNLSGTENMRARLTHNADLTVLGTVRSPIFYDSNDTGYYTDPNNTSRLNVVTSNNINNYGVISTGQSGQDSGISRSSYPYSFGFQQAGAWTGPYPDLVLQYHTGVTIAGNANYDGISFKADHGDDTVIFRVNGGSNYLYKYYWMYTNTTGYYSDTNNWHIEPNSSSSYGGTMIRGTRNGWRGIHFYEGGNVPHMMFDGSANGGVYFETGGRWASYYSYDNNCWGFGTSTTNSAFNIYCPTGVYSGGRVDGTVFYDANNTGYYVDPASTSYLNFINIQSGFANGPVSFLSTVGATSGSLSNPSLQAYSLSNNSAFMSFHKAGHYAVNFGLDSDNVLRIGGWSASANRWQLDMSGNMTAAGNVTAYSDIRLKDNIEPIENALDKVTQLNGVTFTRKDHDDKTRRHAGVIAQEVEKVLPEVVSEDNEGIKNVAYGNMVGLLIEAIKEQNKAIYDLKKEVERLKSKLGE